MCFFLFYFVKTLLFFTNNGTMRFTSRQAPVHVSDEAPGAGEVGTKKSMQSPSDEIMVQ